MHERTLQFNGGLILFLTVLMIDEAFISTALTWFMKRKDNSLRHA